MSKLSAKFDRLSSNVSRLGTAVKTTLNPNHRHDEEWEQEVDAKIEKIRDGHRFRSFAGERDGEYLAWGPPILPSIFQSSLHLPGLESSSNPSPYLLILPYESDPNLSSAQSNAYYRLR
jgi:hypothetical protein